MAKIVKEDVLMQRYDINNNFCPQQDEAGLIKETAEKFLLVTRERPKHLEGICFDDENHMYFVSIYDHKAYRYSFDTEEIETIWEDPYLKPVSFKLHKDGRWFISCLGTEEKSGRIVVVNPDGTTNCELAVGHEIDDVAFAKDGSLYYTLFDGTPYNPCGEVRHISADLQEDTEFIKNLSGPNGIAFSTDESVMWVTEFTGGRLLRIPMNSPYSNGSVAYRFSGYHGPDSCSVDEDDNVYVAHYGQGRVMIFNKFGNPVGVIYMPNRDVGHLLGCTHPMVRPHSRELYITVADDNGTEGSWIMKAEAFGKGNMNMFQFQK